MGPDMMPDEAEFLEARRWRLQFARYASLGLFLVTLPLALVLGGWEPLVLAVLFLAGHGWARLELRTIAQGERLRVALDRLEESGVDATDLRRELKGLPYL